MFHKSCWLASWKIEGLGWNNNVKDFYFIAFELLALNFIHICICFIQIQTTVRFSLICWTSTENICMCTHKLAAFVKQYHSSKV